MIVIDDTQEAPLTQVAALYLAETTWVTSGAALEMMSEESREEIFRRRSVCEHIVKGEGA